MNSHNLLYISAILILVTLLTLSLNKDEKVEAVEEHVTDTMYVTRVDTIWETKVVEKSVRVVDTLYIPKDTSENAFISVLSEQKHYSNPNLYDVYLSGYKAKLDSIKVYPRIEYRTITNSTTKNVILEKWNYYGYIGLNNFYGSFQPNLGFMAQSKKNWLFGAELGLFDNSKFYYGLKIGYKLNRK